MEQWSIFKRNAQDWYNENYNKKPMLYTATGVWTFVMILIISVLSVTGSGTSNAAFYLPIVIFTPLLYFSTYFMLACFFKVFLLETPVYTTHDCTARDMDNDHKVDVI